MPRRHEGPETFPRYQNYLHASMWPSDSSAECFQVTDMVPRYAASALAKLLRWGATYQAKVALNIHNDADRLQYIRNTVLGRALASQAQGLDPERAPEPEKLISTRDLFLRFVTLITESTDLNITAIVELAEALTRHFEEEWTVTARKR